jgi:hypothetical protein
MSEQVAQLAIIVSAFVLTYPLARFIPIHPMVIGCAVPLIAAVGVVFWLNSRPPQSSTEGAAVPFMAIFAAMGSIPAAYFAGRKAGRL